MKIAHLRITKTAVKDLSPLKNVSVNTLHCDFKGPKDIAVLKEVPGLETLNGSPAKDLLK